MPRTQKQIDAQVAGLQKLTTEEAHAQVAILQGQTTVESYVDDNARDAAQKAFDWLNDDDAHDLVTVTEQPKKAAKKAAKKSASKKASKK